MAKGGETDVKGKAINFFQALFDFSFQAFITSKLISFIFGFGVIAGGIFGIITIIGSFTRSAGSGLLMLIVTPLMYLAGVTVLRIWLELVMVIFKIEENTRR